MGVWTLGWGQKGTPQLRDAVTPYGKGGLFPVPQVWGPMAEQDRALEPGWLLSLAGRPYLDSILHKKQRRVFAVPTVTYKLFLVGRSGVGKTALVAWLGGTSTPPAHHETLGIEATTLFWPAKPLASGRPVLFQLHLWDCGDGALRKFEHLLPVSGGRVSGWGRHLQEPAVRGCPRPQACKEEADAALFLFSFTDRASFEELPALMDRVLSPGDGDLIRVVVGTKFDLATHAAVTEEDVRTFEGTWGLRVLRAGGTPGAGGARAGLARVTPVLDALVEGLWRRDQVTAGVTRVDMGDTPT
ncbi:ciliogenesis and planar polarity effector 2 isoform X2 [Cinclus cinclus]|uniref:ciliogenesis and planar polarity effector 2 isoform X2 n=1 Tax=Cinclus cinclus TaxID=127875 RepID=UPI002E14DBA3